MNGANNTNDHLSKWSLYINQKFDEYRTGKRGGAGTLTAFAKQFGASHSVVIGWLRENSEPPRAEKYIRRIIALYGVEAYEPLGIPVPEALKLSADGTPLTEKQIRALALLSEAPEENQDEILDLVEHYLFKHGFRRTR